MDLKVLQCSKHAETVEVIEEEAEIGTAIEMVVDQDLDGTHRQTSALTVVHLVIGLRTVQKGELEEADLETEIEKPLVEKAVASFAERGDIRQKTALTTDEEMLEVVVEVEDAQDLAVITQETDTEVEEIEVILVEKGGEGMIEVTQETEGEGETTRDDPNLTTAEIATTAAEEKRTEGPPNPDPHLEEVDTMTTRKELQAALNLTIDTSEAEAETHQEIGPT